MKWVTDQRYRKALDICQSRLSEVSGDNVCEAAACFFRMGVAFSHLGEIGAAIRCFNDAFMLRDNAADAPDGMVWRDFHDTQMTIYILGKRHKGIVSFAEGDMVHDLIKSRWVELLEEMERSQIPFVGTDMHAWFKTVNIDFPWELEEVQEDFCDQNDLIGRVDIMECVRITQ